jgi:hypothetical protein
MSTFKSGYNGFWLKFDNGVVLSTQFAYGNYCEGHDLFVQKMRDYNKFREDGVKNCEIAVGTEQEPCCLTEVMSIEVFGTSEDMVRGYVTIDDWVQIVNWCHAYKNIK